MSNEPSPDSKAIYDEAMLQFRGLYRSRPQARLVIPQRIKDLLDAADEMTRTSIFHDLDGMASSFGLATPVVIESVDMPRMYCENVREHPAHEWSAILAGPRLCPGIFGGQAMEPGVEAVRVTNVKKSYR